MTERIHWYEIDVKAEVVARLSAYVSERGGDANVLSAVRVASVRDLTEGTGLPVFNDDERNRAAADFARRQYLEVRAAKYGQDEFLSDSRQERLLAYPQGWEPFLLSLLERRIPRGGRVLFAGTADGSEIPSGCGYRYYALEQISVSASRIDSRKVVESVVGDFEDPDLIVSRQGKMSAVVALRCLMPNTRIDRFLRFVCNNLERGGCLIASHPMARLGACGRLVRLEGCEEKRAAFESRLAKACGVFRFVLEATVPTELECFYIMRLAE